ncbi:MAG: PLD nuclease N-terminal domain-containing protein [Actinomycetota bacterium]
MFRFAGLGLVGFIALAVWVYCILDVISSEEVLIRNLPKMTWLLIVLLFSTIGSIVWLAVGRPLYAGWRPGGTASAPGAGGRRPAPPPRRRALGPEDREDFVPRTRPGDEERLRAWEADLRRREQEVRRDDGDEGPPPA